MGITSMKVKVVVAFSIVLFLVLAGTTVSAALWSTSNTLSTTVKAANLADSCSNVTKMENAGFELPLTTQGVTTTTAVPYWKSTDPAGIEIWQSGYSGVVAPVGKQFAELNATRAGTLSQQLKTTPGQTLQWSLLHRARVGTDTMNLWIGAPGAGVLQRVITDNINSGWVRYTGAYVVPADQVLTELGFEAGATGSGDASIGNFLDDVSFGSGPCLTATSTVAKVGTGTITAGSTVQYVTTLENIGSAISSASTVGWILPGNLTIVPSSLTSADYDGTSRKISARVGVGATATAGGTIAPQSTTTFSYQATVNSTVAAQTIISYTPTVSYVNELAPTWPISTMVADAPLTVASRNADLAISSGVNPATFIVGASTPATFVFQVGNATGPSDAAGAVVRLTLPYSLGAAATGSGGSNVTRITGDNMTCALVSTNGTTSRAYDCTSTGDIPVGGGRTLNVATTIPTTATSASSFTVTGVIRSSADPTSSNNTATTTMNSSLSTSTYYKVTVAGGNGTPDCVDASYGGMESGTNLSAWTCTESEKAQQSWLFIPDGDSYRVQRLNARIYWTTTSTSRVGADMQLRSSTNENNQRWKMETQSDGTVRFISAVSSTWCMSRTNANTSYILATATCSTSAAQRFTISAW